MAHVRGEYERLPGRGGVSSLAATRSRLWLGNDHLLYVGNHGYTEDYKRFYYREIQAVITCRTRSRMAWSIVWGAVAALFSLFALLAGDFALKVLFGVVSSLFLLSVLVNWLRGPTCICCLRTAVHLQELPSLSRLSTARKAIALLRGRIEEVQGEFYAEEAQSPMAAVPPAPAAASAPAGPGISLGAPETYSGRTHQILFSLLVADGVVSLACIAFHSLITLMLSLALAAALGICVLLSLIRQRRSGMRGSIAWISWAALGYVVIRYAAAYAHYIYATFKVALTRPGLNDDPLAPLTAMAATSSPEVITFLVLNVFYTVCACLIGGAGLIQIGRYRRGRSALPPPIPEEQGIGAESARDTLRGEAEG